MSSSPVLALSDEDIAAIKSLCPALDKAALAGDWDAVVGLFTEDALLMQPNGPAVQGRSPFKSWIESFDLTITEHAIELIEIDGYGDVAYGQATYVEAMILGGGSEPIREVGKILFIFRRQPDGSWLIAVEMWNSDLPSPE